MLFLVGRVKIADNIMPAVKGKIMNLIQTRLKGSLYSKDAKIEPEKGI